MFSFPMFQVWAVMPHQHQWLCSSAQTAINAQQPLVKVGAQKLQLPLQQQGVLSRPCRRCPSL
jgi:hypothetical protein